MVERRLLMRTVSTVVKHFCKVLTTECEIYLTVLVKSLEQVKHLPGSPADLPHRTVLCV